MSSIALQDLIKETQIFLNSVAEAVAGDEASENDADIIKQRKAVVESKYRSFMTEFNNNKSQAPTNERLHRLEALRKEVARKDGHLDSLQKQLKEFELELYLRSGGVRKRELEQQAATSSIRKKAETGVQ